MRQRDEERTRQSLTPAERASEQSPCSHSLWTMRKSGAATLVAPPLREMRASRLAASSPRSRRCTVRPALTHGLNTREVRDSRCCSPAWHKRGSQRLQEYHPLSSGLALSAFLVELQAASPPLVRTVKGLSAPLFLVPTCRASAAVGSPCAAAATSYVERDGSRLRTESSPTGPWTSCLRHAAKSRSGATILTRCTGGRCIR